MKRLFQTVNGVISSILYFINTVVLAVPLIILSFLKLAPISAWQRLITYILDGIATLWISINNLNQRIFSRTEFTTTPVNELSVKSWYLIVANHQSWVDILVLQRIFNREIPFIKFFLKKNLIYVPFLGLAWWALDFPFMHRHSKAYLQKHPHLKGKDLATTKQACEKFEHKPVSIMNFVEGTRFDPAKLAKDGEFHELLPPKSGGIAFVLSAMGERLSEFIDVTICYPEGIPSYWDFVCGRVRNVAVDIQTVKISNLYEDKIFSQDYFSDESNKRAFQEWLNQRWKDKQALLIKMKSEYQVK